MPSADRPSHAPQIDAEPSPSPVRRFHHGDETFRWEEVALKTYKPEGDTFKDVTRQVLFDGAGDLASQLRYFEVAPGGHSTLEQHRHVHAVLVLRGSGRVLVGRAIHAVAAFDLVYVPPFTWHQFRAAEDEPLGFLCLVACDRDRPIRPDEAQREAFLADPEIGPFVRC